MSDTEAEFFTALAAFQAEVPPIRKSEAVNAGQRSYSFAPLDTILDTIRPALTKNGLAWTARPTVTEHGFVLRSSLVHTGGHREESDYPLPDPASNGAQIIGSALTYARRYSLTALLGVAPSGEDDDGQKAADARSTYSQPDPSASLRSQIAAIGKRMGWDPDRITADFAEWNVDGLHIASADPTTLTAYRDYLDEERKRLNREQAQLAQQPGYRQDGKPKKGQQVAERLDATPTDDTFYAEPATT